MEVNVLKQAGSLGEKGHIRKILVTGSEGYIGSVLMPMLIKEGYDVTGLDTCFFAEGNLTNERILDYKLIKKDIRDVKIGDLQGFDAIIHLAGLSNDPLGDLDENLTLEINYLGSVNLAKLAKEAGIKRFIFSSSCSLYGAGAGKLLTEEDESNPQTPYGKSKILAENEITKLAEDDFSPVFMRNSTAMGVSPRMRFDIVVNQMCGNAKAKEKIFVFGKKTPWRPLVHIKDISGSFIAVLKADKETIHNQVFNVGDEKENYQIRNLAETIQERGFPDAEIVTVEGNLTDVRDYKVSFDKLNRKLGYSASVSVHDCISELRQAYDKVNLDVETLEHPLYVKLKQVKKLMEEGKIDKSLRWKKPDFSFEETPLKNAYIIEINQFKDERGMFEKMYSKKVFEENGLKHMCDEINHSLSKDKGTIRGMHFQLSPDCQAKIVRCVKGSVFDVIIDIRKGSPTFLKWFGITLSENDNKMLYVPKGFAHGFQTLEDNTEIIYNHDGYYNPTNEGAIRFNDPRIGIKFPLGATVVSEKDRKHDLLDDKFEGIEI